MSADAVVFETVVAGDWVFERLASVIDAVNQLLFKEAWDAAREAAEHWKAEVFRYFSDESVSEPPPLAERMIVTPDSHAQLIRAVLNRYALAEAHPFWPTLALPQRVMLANRLCLLTAERFLIVRTKRYRRAPVPLDTAFEYRAPDGSWHRLRVDLISPVPGYETPR